MYYYNIRYNRSTYYIHIMRNKIKIIVNTTEMPFNNFTLWTLLVKLLAFIVQTN